MRDERWRKREGKTDCVYEGEMGGRGFYMKEEGRKDGRT
jgi:hypothetical protein